jgi:tetratricopeptide (TPR) repeat protein
MHGLNSIPADSDYEQRSDADLVGNDPASAEAYRKKGDALLELERFGEALECYDRAIAIKPDDPRTHNNRASALKNLRRYNEALDSYERAIALLPTRVELHSNRGNLLQELERFEEALESYDTAIALRPDYAETYSNRGVVLRNMMQFEESAASFDRALLLKPDHAEAIWNKALLHLLLGEFEIGWRGYEARKRTKRAAGSRSFAKPLWLGDADISGKTLLIHWEQGFGDVIQFSRYVTLCQETGARVLFAPQRALQTLMRGLDAKVPIVDVDSDVLLFDFHCPLMSLPLAFKTELATIPPPSYISADEEKIAAWAHRLGKKTKPRVGVVWGTTGLQLKSVPLERFGRLFDPRIQFVSLQKLLSEAERDYLDRADVVHPGEMLFDFSDTAALCRLMDLVICVDTSVAHLAGALSTPVWVLIPQTCDWRWMLDREDTPWYPSMRLFRQQVRSDWDGVLQRVQAQLRARFG